MTASQSPTEYVRQLLERLRPDRRMSLAICLGAAACFGPSPTTTPSPTWS